MAQKRTLKSFADLVPRGENPQDVVIHEPNGTSKIDTGAGEQQWKWGYQADGARFNGGEEDYLSASIPSPVGKRKRR